LNERDLNRALHHRTLERWQGGSIHRHVTEARLEPWRIKIIAYAIFQQCQRHDPQARVRQIPAILPKKESGDRPPPQFGDVLFPGSGREARASRSVLQTALKSMRAVESLSAYRYGGVTKITESLFASPRVPVSPPSGGTGGQRLSLTQTAHGPQRAEMSHRDVSRDGAALGRLLQQTAVSGRSP
jgi:hypothetical protein